MLIPVIKFEITDFRKKTSEAYCILNTEDNWNKVASHKYTREIEFTNEMDVTFAHVMRIPQAFILETPLDDQLDEIDEMVGMVL